MRRLVALPLAASLLAGDPAAAPPLAEPRAEESKPSAIAALHLKPLSGDEIVLAERLARGPVVFDFWATWCRPCAFSLPEMQKLHETYRPRGLTVIGVSLDGPPNAAKVPPFAARYGLTFPNVLDQGTLQGLFQVRALPTSYLVNSKGEIAFVQMGYRPGGDKDLAAEIEKLLPPPADSTAAPGPAPERGG
jgi:thiol-disulfide isomerase/thioredoxin